MWSKTKIWLWLDACFVCVKLRQLIERLNWDSLIAWARATNALISRSVATDFFLSLILIFRIFAHELCLSHTEFKLRTQLHIFPHRALCAHISKSKWMIIYNVVDHIYLSLSMKFIYIIFFAEKIRVFFLVKSYYVFNDEQSSEAAKK